MSQALQDETFLISLSFLDAASLARSESICRSWRGFILSNPTLHQTFTLSNCSRCSHCSHTEELERKPSNLDQITIPLKRESRLCNNTFKNVSIQLYYPYWLKPKNPEEPDFIPIFEVLLQSRETLQWLHLDIQEYSYYDNQSHVDWFYAGGEIEKVSESQRGEVNRSLFLQLEAGVLKIESTVKEDQRDGPTEATFLVFIKSILEYFGNFKQFKMMFDNDMPWTEPEISGEIIEVLSSSSQSFESLGLKMLDTTEPIAAFNLILGCPKLKQVAFMRSASAEGSEIFEVSDNVERLSEGLEEVDFSFDSNSDQILWNKSMITWLGKKLKSLALDNISWCYVEYNQGKSLLPIEGLITVLENCENTIENLKLSNVKFSGVYSPIGRENGATFSRLQSIDLSSHHPGILDFLSTSYLPSLRKAHLKGSSWDNPSLDSGKGELTKMKGLMAVLKRASSSLEQISLKDLVFDLTDFNVDGVSHQGFKEEFYSFPKLEKLEVIRCGSTIAKTLIKSKCPRLKFWRMIHEENTREEKWLKISATQLLWFLHHSAPSLVEIEVDDLVFELGQEMDPLRLDHPLNFPSIKKMVLKHNFLSGSMRSNREAVLSYFPSAPSQQDRSLSNYFSKIPFE